MSEDTNAKTDEKPGFSFSRWLLWSVAVLVIYLLSAGPANMLYMKHYDWWRSHPKARDALMIFYWPVIWASEHTILANPINSYMEWWERKGSAGSYSNE